MAIFTPNNEKINMSQDLFKQICTAIRKEQLYAKVDLMREDIMKRFGIGRHRLNALLNSHADGMSFPQFINAIRMEEAYKLLTDHPEMTIAEIARLVGFTAPNLREQFKRCYGTTPAEYRAGLLSDEE
jgi:AraC-like DNA-binding protein